MRTVQTAKATYVVVLVLVIAGALVIEAFGFQHTSPARYAAPANRYRGTSRLCLYTRRGIGGLRRAERALQAKATCTLVFHHGATWAQWTVPSFDGPTSVSETWAQWAVARPGRRLIISVPLIPTAERAVRDWRSRGASGDFAQEDRSLAENLVRAGLGTSFIRLGSEGNGRWSVDWIGDTVRDWQQWAAFWRATASAMRSVRGAHFRFVWTISPDVGRAPLSAYYPGDGVVDVIGMDVYDAGFVFLGADRWRYLLDRPNGIGAVMNFAVDHHKPVAFPEWGLIPGPRGGADDSSFVAGVAALSRRPGLAFETYWDAGASATAIAHSPRSRAAFRRLLGSGNSR